MASSVIFGGFFTKAIRSLQHYKPPSTGGFFMRE